MREGRQRERGRVEVRVQSVGAGGVGVGTLPDGRVVFLPRTAPGDRVRARIVQEKDRWARGEAEEWLEEGPGRRTPPCPRYAECDGCTLQHLEYGEQLRWKGVGVGEAIRRIGGMVVEDPPVEPSPRQTRYRNKVTFTLRRLGGGRVVAGFRELGSRGRVLDVGPECLLPQEEVGELWRQLREGWGEGARLLPGGRELRLTLRAGREGGGLMVRGGWGDGDPSQLLRAVPGLRGLWRDEKGLGIRHLAGEGSLLAEWMGEELELRGGAFLQVNREAAEGLHRHLRGVVGPLEGLRVLDAYCGAGTLAQQLARDGASVVGIEADPQAAAMARKGEGERLRVVEARVEDVLEGLLPADLVLLNPPRRGLATPVPVFLARRPPARMIYVSCDPGTLARDLKRMGDAFRVVGVRAFDLFPQTFHVETVVVLATKDG